MGKQKKHHSAQHQPAQGGGDTTLIVELDGRAIVKQVTNQLPSILPLAGASTDHGAVLDAPASAQGQVVLLRESVDARGVKCPAGMVIGPEVEGWPKHRVDNHVRNKMAK